jgi:hypothetical protein
MRTELDPFGAALLTGRNVFVGRQLLRRHLRELSDVTGPRVLLVDGPLGSGKSHTVALIRHLSLQRQFRIALVDVEQEAFHALLPADVAQRLMLQLGGSDAAMPAQLHQQTSRYVVQLSDWVVAHIQRSAAEWWIVFDGFDHADVPVETRDFIARLAMDADVRATNLRIVLLGWSDDLVPLALRSRALRETIAPAGEQELRRFFEQLSNEGSLPLDAQGVDQVVEAVVQAVANHDVPSLEVAAARAVSLLR